MVGLGSMGKFGSIVKEGLDQVIFVAKLFCGLHVTNTYLCSIALSYGPSMLPTISLDNSLLLVEKMTTHFGKFGHGDIVLVRSPENPRKVITKRLTGMEGDSISYLVDPKNSDRSETIVVRQLLVIFLCKLCLDVLADGFCISSPIFDQDCYFLLSLILRLCSFLSFDQYEKNILCFVISFLFALLNLATIGILVIDSGVWLRFFSKRYFSFLIFSLCRFQGDMSGYRETTYMLPMIQDILGLFLMAFLKAEYSGGYGRLKVLEHWGKLIEG
ncbi:mitochondrial inner membrane protease subunit 1-like [Quillaja saponaria]|uniref:Mitochondrial inner membrane protease subunit 1-like n=1 Tax=Quillaja saponaria TaxID=32244 RepID=A0AAD7PA45_QUISA|nr:mitochondrial inner membrane protease subunit 1-like [Quillaja saponaria]